MAAKSDDNWQIEALFKKAFIRTKERFFSYFLSAIMMWGAFLASFIIAAIVGGGLGYAAYSSQNMILLGVVVVVMVLLFVVVAAYIGSWWALAMVEILTQTSKTDVMGAFKKVKPLVWGYAGIQGLMWLLFMGLAPFVVLSLGVVAVLWLFWSIFIVFAYLEKGKRGMDAIWYSRALTNQRFWPIAGRTVVVLLLLVVVQIVLGMGHNSVLKVLSWFVSMVSSPFILSYYYEMYKNLNQDVKGEKSTGWIIASVIGWIVIVIGIVSLSVALPGLLKDNKINPNELKNYQYNFGKISPTSFERPAQNTYQM